MRRITEESARLKHAYPALRVALKSNVKSTRLQG